MGLGHARFWSRRVGRHLRGLFHLLNHALAKALAFLSRAISIGDTTRWKSTMYEGSPIATDYGTGDPCSRVCVGRAAAVFAVRE